MIKDYYSTLGLTSDAALIEIKKAYRRLALEYHPDKNKSENAAQKFIEITEAYEVLKDPFKKAEYDRLYSWYYQRESLKEPIFEENDSESKQQQWAEYGRQKAREYSALSIEDFARRILKEIGVGVSYIPNIIAISIVVIMGITMLAILPEISEDSPGAVIFILLLVFGFGYLAYRLFDVAKSDYMEDRKRKL